MPDKFTEEDVTRTKAAVVKHLREKYNGDLPRGNKAGCIDCPVCGKRDGLIYKFYVEKNYIGGACVSRDCVIWKEGAIFTE